MEPERTTATATVPAPQQRQTVLWIIAILLAIIATTLLVRSQDSLALTPAFADQPMAGARGVFAFTGQLDKNRYGLFMMDVDSSNVWCYEYLPSTRKLKLVAARSFRFDRYLENYSCDEPSPEQIQEMLREQNRVQQRNEGGGIVPDQSETGLPGTSSPNLVP